MEAATWDSGSRAMIRELLQVPNLMSIARILLIPFIGYYLMQPGRRAILVRGGGGVSRGVMWLGVMFWASSMIT